MPDIGGNGAALMAARYGMPNNTGELPPALAALLDRRVTRRYKPDPVPEKLLEALLAAAQSAPRVRIRFQVRKYGSTS